MLSECGGLPPLSCRSCDAEPKRRQAAGLRKRSSALRRPQAQPGGGAAAERQRAHVGAGHRHRPVLLAAGQEKRKRKIAADGTVTGCSQLDDVPSLAAGEIEQRTMQRAALRLEKRDLPLGLVL